MVSIQNVNIQNNTFTYNYINGDSITSNGFQFSDCQNNTIAYNYIINCTSSGIYFQSAHNNTILNNTMLFCDDEGITFQNSDWCKTLDSTCPSNLVGLTEQSIAKINDVSGIQCQK